MPNKPGVIRIGGIEFDEAQEMEKSFEEFSCRFPGKTDYASFRVGWRSAFAAFSAALQKASEVEPS